MRPSLPRRPRRPSRRDEARKLLVDSGAWIALRSLRDITPRRKLCFARQGGARAAPPTLAAAGFAAVVWDRDSCAWRLARIHIATLRLSRGLRDRQRPPSVSGRQAREARW